MSGSSVVCVADMVSILCRGTGISLVLGQCVRLLLDGRNSVV